VKTTKLVLTTIMLIAAAIPVQAAFTTAVQLETQRVLTADQLAGALAGSQVVIVGEHHTNRQHHLAQRQIVDLLHRAGRDVAVGLEMFRAEAQKTLDGWVSGRVNEDAFIKAFMDNWGYDWAAYRPVFVLARESRIPMIGLNVSREVTRQVFYHGFESLTAEQRKLLGNITCEIDDSYRKFIERSYGGHGGVHGGVHGGSNFDYFCEAQLVWDSVMAVNILAYLNRNPNAVVVAMVGAGHARNPGIPAQLRKRSDAAVTVLMPLAPGIIDRTTVGPEDADYLLILPYTD
jgi:uncharacterized iron-regulated protein